MKSICNLIFFKVLRGFEPLKKVLTVPHFNHSVIKPFLKFKNKQISYLHSASIIKHFKFLKLINN